MARGDTGKKFSQSADQSKRLPGKPIADPGAVEPTQHREPKTATPIKRRSICGPPVSPHAFTVIEFCKAHRISKAKYYELKLLGLAPIEMQVGRRRLVSFESAERWRREREAAAQNAA